MRMSAKIHVQCRARGGRLGTFIGLHRVAYSPVFADLLGLFFWMKIHEWWLSEYENGGYGFFPWRATGG